MCTGRATLPGGPHILDGEVCVLDDLGRSDFNRLQDRAGHRRWVEGGDPALLDPLPASVLLVGHPDDDEDL